MPYSGANDSKLPSNVQKLGSETRSRWVGIFNSAYRKAIAAKKPKSKAEAAAFTAANGWLKSSKEEVQEGELSRIIEVTPLDQTSP
tara:strand:- start:378 stop:635 length:258 start_codon:yes stop_codon:yes gene_type:complete